MTTYRFRITNGTGFMVLTIPADSFDEALDVAVACVQPLGGVF